MTIAPVPQVSEVVQPDRTVSLPWFTWLNALRATLVQLATTIHIVQGNPNGTVYGSVGHLALRTDGGAGSTLYVKESGTNTTAGWVAK